METDVHKVPYVAPRWVCKTRKLNAIHFFADTEIIESYRYPTLRHHESALSDIAILTSRLAANTSMPAHR